MIKFTSQYDENSPLIEMMLQRDSTLDELLENFEGFLKAAGYAFDGKYLDFVSDSDANVEE